MHSKIIAELQSLSNHRILGVFDQETNRVE